MNHKLWAVAFAAILSLGLQLPAPAAAEDQAAASGGYTTHFRLAGDVEKPANYDLHDLQALPPTTENVFFYTGKGPVQSKFTGVLLWDLLAAAKIKTDPNIKNGILRKSVVVSGSDGYAVRLSAGEIEPASGGEQVIVAYAQDGAPLGKDSGFARLIVPGDKAGARDVFWIARITVE